MGLTRLFATLQDNAAYLGMGNATAASIQRYKFTVIGEKLNGYVGNVGDYAPQLELDGDVSVEMVMNTEQLEEVIDVVTALSLVYQTVFAYDSSILGFDRHDFLRKYAIDSRYGCCFV